MDSFASKLRRYRTLNKLTLDELADRLSTSKQVLSRYENEVRIPKVTTVYEYARALGISFSDLLPDDSAEITALPISDREWAEPLVAAYTGAEKPTQEGICRFLDIGYVDPQNHEAESETEVFRISDQPAAAGTGVYLGPESFHEVYINVNKLPKNAIFGIPIQGNSMEPRFHDGEVVIVTRDEPRIGEIGVFTMEGQGYLKQLGKNELISLNGGYHPIPMDESIRCNGKVVGVLQEEWVVG